MPKTHGSIIYIKGEVPNHFFVSDVKSDLTESFRPEDVFEYAYAVFHSPTCRSRYAEFLKIDFPRLPLTSDKELLKGGILYGGKSQAHTNRRLLWLSSHL